MTNTKPARGMRDFLPSDVRKREYVIGIIKAVYESYGFEPLETPAVENIETLTGKYGEEGNQLIYKILKRGEKLDASLDEKDLADLALRYDLTVPLARVVANHRNDLPRFFKRYQIQPVWRADRPARGRFREFYQCDVDAIGSNSMIVEAELCAAVSEILMRLGFDDFTIRINHRRILTGILEAAGVETERHTDALVALDKIDKIGREGVEKEFRIRGISKETTTKLLTFFEFFIKEKSNNFFNEEQKTKLASFQKDINRNEESFNTVETVINKLINKKFDEINKEDFEFASKWIDQYLAVIDNAKKEVLGIAEKLLQSNSVENHFLVTKRDLAKNKSRENEILEILLNLRKTVPIYETFGFIKQNIQGVVGIADLFQFLNYIETTSAYAHIKFDPTLARGLSYYTGAIFEINVPDLAGSLGGGGRYDGLIGMFGKEQIPACGFSLGLERILVVMEERGMFPPELTNVAADVLVTVWSKETIGESLKLAGELRREKLRVLVYPEADKLGKQFKYAGQINVPFVCVLGETELAEDKVTLKNMRTGEQEIVSREDIAGKINKLPL